MDKINKNKDIIGIYIMIISVLIDFVLIFLDTVNYINTTPIMLVSILFIGGVLTVVYLIISIIYELINFYSGGKI